MAQIRCRAHMRFAHKQLKTTQRDTTQSSRIKFMFKFWDHERLRWTRSEKNVVSLVLILFLKTDRLIKSIWKLKKTDHFHPKLRLCTKLLVLFLHGTTAFRSPPQGSQAGPAFARADNDRHCHYSKIKLLFSNKTLKTCVQQIYPCTVFFSSASYLKMLRTNTGCQYQNCPIRYLLAHHMQL
jgi:hypothetical protein